MRILLKDKNSDIFDLLIHLEQSEHFVAHLGTFMNRLLMHCKPLWKVFAFSCNFLLFDEAEGLWVKQKSIVWGGGGLSNKWTHRYEMNVHVNQNIKQKVMPKKKKLKQNNNPKVNLTLSFIWMTFKLNLTIWTIRSTSIQN